MKKLIEHIILKEFDQANQILEETFPAILRKKLFEMKKMVAATVCEEKSEDIEPLDEARIKIIKARVRQGKIQRRKKVSNVPGYTLRSGKLTRMSPMERRKRKMGARRAKIKRRGKMSRTLIKRKRSLRKRASIGLR